ncbi:DUF2318 domain-containing protein [Roseospira marina]|uniref:DUF2318 domain-containing protein n=1 Tax=Roseospira marina TaxID=140057 RepID=A0A5M6ICR7_9PROT|nr:Fe-S-containing protein [Roseospira marina]KAA5606026.1 DUF2318 domain-containing protein [Roseospira marina]MBB4313116.1 putative membrane protein/YHS domain-containing protein [Roseospira marina]MBB5086143.1 putative membrane protein/YHS domain-containing protein [Roseospira marina]
MTFFITTLAHALVPLALVVALLPAAASSAPTGGISGGRAVARHGGTLLMVGVGLILGALAALVAALQASETEISTLLHSVAFGVGALTLLALALSAGTRRLGAPLLTGVGLLLVGVLAARGVFEAWAWSMDRSLTATDVINTELIVNCAGLIVGAALVALLAAVTWRVALTAGRLAAGLALAVVLVAEVLTGSASALLGLLRLDMVTVTSGRISYVAKVTMLDPWVVYMDLALVGALVLVAFLRRPRVPAVPAAASSAERVAHRRHRARAVGHRQWRTAVAAVGALLLVTISYQDLYASLPPSLSPAEPVEMDAAGELRIPIDAVKDGTLHRYAYIASDGHRVRFFLINRYDPEHAYIGVVYDACMICGDDGYIQKGDEIICIACNVRIFRPTIGKAGGCNPIPLDHTVEDDTIVITRAALEKGARYFSEVVEVEATDPVTGETVINLKAPYQYDYGGRTYFFGSEDSYETFRADPEAYTGEDEARYLRIQGHQSTEG